VSPDAAYGQTRLRVVRSERGGFIFVRLRAKPPATPRDPLIAAGEQRLRQFGLLTSRPAYWSYERAPAAVDPKRNLASQAWECLGFGHGQPTNPRLLIEVTLVPDWFVATIFGIAPEWWVVR